jgi:O-antigen ligase
MRKNVSIIKFVSVLSLFCSFTNFVPISAAISAFSLLLYPFSVAVNKVSRPIIPLLAFFIYASLSTLFYDATSLFDVDFYRRDGNFFVTMTPLLFLSSTIFFVNLDRTLRWFVYVSTFANAAVLAAWLATGGIALFRGQIGYEPYTPIYHFLFIAHNAAGGFLAMLSAYSVAMLFERRNLLTASIVAVNLAALFLTSSRGSMLGLAIAVVLVVFAGRFRDKFYPVVIPALAINLLIVLYIYSNSDINYIIYRQALLTRVVATLDPGIAGYLDDNASIRLETSWPLAMHAFFQSPIVGIGFGAFDDLPWNFWGWPGVFAFNSPEWFWHTDAHAHHTFLHVMAEMGAVGLVLLLWFLNRLHAFLQTLESPMVRRALLLGFWVSVVSSFTEHRLFTPSQMLPFVIMVGLAFAHTNYQEAQRRAARPTTQPALAGLARDG